MITHVRKRVGALIISDKRLLLVCGHGKKEYWTPGGGIEHGESDEDCLRRELHEELGVEVESMKFYKEYQSPSRNNPRRLSVSRLYLTTITGILVPSQEIASFHWVTSTELAFPGEITCMPVIKELLIPDLLKDGLIE